VDRTRIKTYISCADHERQFHAGHLPQIRAVLAMRAGERALVEGRDALARPSPVEPNPSLFCSSRVNANHFNLSDRLNQFDLRWRLQR